MICLTNTWKIIQRKSYDILSHKYSAFIIILAFLSVVISAIQFGEAWMIWSHEKYEAVFNSFSDNIIGKSLQSRLCQVVPIDVVYTWVNGSDPLLIENLQTLQRHLRDETSKKCPFQNCVPSHVLAFREWMKDVSHNGIIIPANTNFIADGYHKWRKVRTFSPVEKLLPVNWTLIEFIDDFESKRALQIPVHYKNKTIFPSVAHWTSDASAPNNYAVPNALIFNCVSPEFPLGKIKDILLKKRLIVEPKFVKEWSFPNKCITVMEYSSKGEANNILQEFKDGLFIDEKKVNISKAFLMLELPISGNPKDFSPSRYEDKEELRYSLRSLEKFAPWVRHVYIVTNGQIPYWLNLDNPRLTVVTHQEIFPDPTHLPTFSSPAIESHIHRIPGLSNMFLYLNDDVMFGREVWPDDFITNAKGQKVYFSWSVPDCSESCPWSWVGDGSCDLACNNTDCSFDGGDCDPSNEELIPNDATLYDDDQHVLGHEDPFDSHNLAPDDDSIFNHFEFHNENFAKLKNSDIGNSKSLDNMQLFNQSVVSNVVQNISLTSSSEPMVRGFYSPITSTQVPNKNILEISVNENRTQSDGTSFIQRNIMSTDIKNVDNYNLILDSQLFVSSVQSVGPELTHSTTLSGNNDNHMFKQYNKDIIVNSSIIHKNEQILSAKPSHSFPRRLNIGSDYILNMIQNNSYRNPLSHGTETLFNYLNDTVRKPTYFQKSYYYSHQNRSNDVRIHKLEARQRGLELMEKTFHSFQQNMSENFVEAANVESKSNVLSKVKSKKSLSQKLGYGMFVNKPKDSFAESLLHVNRLYNKVYGLEPRKVPAHMPHLINKTIMEDLQLKFSKEWFVTSTHKIRSPDDMQYAFSYFYFLLSEKSSRSIGEIFDIYDTDQSGTWSDREIRTLLTRIYSLPLNYNYVVQFENLIINCSKVVSITLSHIDMTTPPFERYQDSKLPTVSKELISNCDSMKDLLIHKFGTITKYKSDIVKDKYQDVTFKMLNSNVSHLITFLDEIRREPKKFICLNDNLDPTREKDNTIVRAILQDFYEALFPLPSSFELPAEYRNRFLHVSELQSWKRNRNIIKVGIYVCIIFLIFFTVCSFFNIECRLTRRRRYSVMKHRFSLDV